MPQFNRISAAQFFVKSPPDTSHYEDDHYTAQFWILLHKSQYSWTDSRGYGSEPGVKTVPVTFVDLCIRPSPPSWRRCFSWRHTRFDWQADVTLWNCFWLMTVAEKNKNSGWCVEVSARSSWGLIHRSNSHIDLILSVKHVSGKDSIKIYIRLCRGFKKWI